MPLSLFHGGRRRPGRLFSLLGLFLVGAIIAELLGNYSQSNIKQVLLKQLKTYRGNNTTHDHDGLCRTNAQNSGMQDTCDLEADGLLGEGHLGAQEPREGLGKLVKPTTIPHGAVTHGFTVFDDLYLRDGTLYVVTNDRKSFPRLREILAKPIKMEPGAVLAPTSDVSVLAST